MRVITFNSQATAALQGRTGSKLRVEAKDGALFIRPTDRKAGPHVLTEMEAKGKNGVMVQITDKHLEKLGASDLLADAATFGLAADRYGWFVLRSGDDLGEKAIEGAEATVTIKAEPTAEAPAAE